MHISSDGADAGDIPALRWRNASGDDKLAIMTNLGATDGAHQVGRGAGASCWLLVRWEKKPENYLGLIPLASALLWFRRYLSLVP
jgi:hypothetical protein